MNLKLDLSLAEKYISHSQKARVLSESWVKKEIFCPNCGDAIYQYNNNKPVADFYYKKCMEDFELKSKKGSFGKKISAGSYSKIIERISSKEKPNFFFMAYILELLSVRDFFIVPKHFFVSNVLEKRSPLSDTARRAGWIGSNILLSKIPEAGQIYYIKNGKELSKKDVLEKWKRTLFIKNVKIAKSKGWILDIMKCIDILDKKDFSLHDIYAFENDLSKQHPENKNIRPKIRQQLQFLRDKGYLEFKNNGRYRLK